MNCLMGFRISERNQVDESTSTEPWGNPEQGSQDTSKSSHELPMEPRAKVEPGSGKHNVYTHLLCGSGTRHKTPSPFWRSTQCYHCPQGCGRSAGGTAED